MRKQDTWKTAILRRYNQRALSRDPPLAYKAADSGLLSPELTAGIRRVKGTKKLGIRFGHCLTCEEARSLWQAPDQHALKGKRDQAIMAVLLGCGLRRREFAGLQVSHLQQYDDHWAIVDLNGKGGHIRTVPVPEWVWPGSILATGCAGLFSLRAV